MNENGCVLVCVTDQIGCQRLIRTGKSLADKGGLPLKVVSVLPVQKVSRHTAEVLQALYDIACRNQAGMEILFNDSPALTVGVYARQCGAKQVVMGMPDFSTSEFIETIRKLYPELPLVIVGNEGQCHEIGPGFTP